ncbi:aldo/keto reductase [Streptomyces netropsis]|uniref:Aryl-alcohol dehydrogenase-like predicted oxidoreductase n=1 Tax=Streptomyces netropsis TaxID=55404 RepID=A0A7W7L6K0_STRNE|nr:aldo/keto reductase [Streptomyces netropsis]MBB4884444.1 aryl-alcohol dehydrogenase-like predicted oxidoreductase [Streptomyces netropsis]GGR03654.1 aldo/keto reductase [Streptomyces netropsis]
MSNDRIDTVALGTGGPLVGVQGLGCMGMSASYGPTDETEARATLEHALERGVTLFDTADIYGFGRNEEFIAPFVRAHRDHLTLATKFAIERREDDPSFQAIRNDRGYIRASVEGSLRRLGVDHIDLYYMHRRNVDVPMEESVGAMAELVAEGKVRHLGLSEVSPGELRTAHAVHPIAAVQSEWSLFSRDVEAGVVDAAKELGVAFVPYSPLGRGFLTGSFVSADKELDTKDWRRTQPRFTGDNAAANAALLEPVRKIAEARGISLAQVALAWVQQRAEVHGLSVIPIPGTRKRTRIEENLAATRIVLDAAELAQLEPIAGKVAGNRYTDMTFTAVGRE